LTAIRAFRKLDIEFEVPAIVEPIAYQPYSRNPLPLGAHPWEHPIELAPLEHKNNPNQSEQHI
jgi:hypothetical protein